ncbi:MAG: hypothetical protein GX591_13005 [Planctomycetes bacterium]|nr:hypothetical protein [Planctomycetota bacterium]
MRNILAALTAAAVLALVGPAALADGGDSRLQAATDFVRRSDRYLHHDELRRGMKGYGLTVMSGTEIVRFEVEIVSVMKGYGPNRDVILARLNGQGLDVSGIIAGMSGSPVFIHHDGKDKMIGAVAYGWLFQKPFDTGPLCGIQPITQMLALSDSPLDGGADAAPRAEAPVAPRHAPGSVRLPEEYRERMFDPGKIDFSPAREPGAPPSSDSAASSSRLTPLSTPVMVGGLSERTLSYLAGALAARGMTPVQSGPLGSAPAEDLPELRLEPGSALVVPLISGDMDASAVGTVTEVLNGHVIGFGHPMFGDGDVSYPMATGYVHTVVASAERSFKLGGPVKVVGEITADEVTAIGGGLGRDVSMVPVQLDLTWHDGRVQRLNYEVLRERTMTPVLTVTALMESVWGTRMLPREHTVQYDVEIDFADLGTYRAENVSAGTDLYGMISDLTRPLALLLDNPFEPVRVEGIRLGVRVESGTKAADLLGATLDRNSYAPGDTVEATVQLRRYKGERFAQTLRLKLPETLEPGQYRLRIGDWRMALEDLRRRDPRRFDPRSAPELLRAVQTLADGRMDRIWGILHVSGEGLTVDTRTIADVPPTVAGLLSAARPLDVAPTTDAITAEVPVDVVVSGRTDVTINVTRHPPRP